VTNTLKYSNGVHLQTLLTNNTHLHIFGNIMKSKYREQSTDTWQEHRLQIEELSALIATLPKTDAITIVMDMNCHMKYTGPKDELFTDSKGNTIPFRKYTNAIRDGRSSPNATLLSTLLHPLNIYIATDLNRNTYHLLSKNKQTVISSTSIDHVWMNPQALKILKVRYMDQYWDNSDHTAIQLNLPPTTSYTPHTPSNKPRPPPHPFNAPLFHTIMSSPDIQSILQSIHSDTKNSNIIKQQQLLNQTFLTGSQRYHELLRLHPRYTKNMLTPALQWTTELQNARSAIQTHTHHRSLYPSQLPPNAQPQDPVLANLKKTYQRLLAKARDTAIDYQHKLIQDTTLRNPRRAWGDILGQVQPKQPILTRQQSPSLQMAPAIDFFTRLYSETNHDPVPDEYFKFLPKPHLDHLPEGFSDHLFNQEFTLEELHIGLKNLKNNKAPDPDGLVTEMLKEIGPLGHDSILTIINHLFLNDLYPIEWGAATLTLLHKKGDRTDPANYRPIGINPTQAKLLSTLISTRLREFVVKTGLIPDTQYGFSEDRRCEDAILMLIHKIQTAIDNNQHLHAIFIDFRKAFDTVPHKLLIDKLSYMGVEGHLLKSISNMYAHTQFSLKLEGVTSDQPIQQQKGVRQGDPLSPLLYILYVADLQNFLAVALGSTHDTGNFADDSYFLNLCTERMQNACDRLSIYCKIWHLIVNTDKTEALIFHKFPISFARKKYKVPTHQYNFEGNPLSLKTVVKFLGTLIDHHGSLKPMLTHIISNTRTAASRFLGWLLREDHVPPIHITIQIFNFTVVSQATYALCIWGAYAPVKKLEEIHQIIDNCTRSILNLPNYSTPLLFTTMLLSLPTFYTRRDTAILSFLSHIESDYPPTHPLNIIINTQLTSLKLTQHKLPNLPVPKGTPTNRQAINIRSTPGRVTRTWLETAFQIIQLTIPISETILPRTASNALMVLRKTRPNLGPRTLLDPTQYSKSKYPILSELAPSFATLHPPKGQHFLLPFLSQITIPKHRNALATIILGCHNLGIERGRHQRPLIPYNHRTCRLCNSPDHLEEVDHIFFSCTHHTLTYARRNLLSIIPTIPFNTIPDTPSSFTDLCHLLLLPNQPEIQKALGHIAKVSRDLCKDLDPYPHPPNPTPAFP
jgi:hypothetical protein